MVNQKFSCRRGRFHTGVGNHVNHRVVTFMSDTSDDRQRKLCHVLRQQQRVEPLQVRCCATPSDDDHHIPLVHPLSNAVQGGYHAALHFISLHNSSKQFGFERQASLVVIQLVAEVAIPCCRCRRDDCHTL